MLWNCGARGCPKTHPNPQDRCQTGVWYCGRVKPPCPGHDGYEYPHRCPSGEEWTCGSSDCDAYHKEPDAAPCVVGKWYCGRLQPPCPGHSLPDPNHRCGRQATLLLDGNVEAAMRALRQHVQSSHANALLYAIRAYYNCWLTYRHDRIRNPYFFFIDFGLGRNQRRGYLLDMCRRSVLEGGAFTVAHGQGRPRRCVDVPDQFANGQYLSSLGLYITRGNVGVHNGSYLVHGESREYTSDCLRFDGLSGDFNSLANDRGVYLHAAPYVTADSAGCSDGCPAVEMSRQQTVIHRMAGGGVVFIFSPNDAAWMRGDPWVHRRGYPAADARRNPPALPHIYQEAAPELTNIA